MTQRSLGRVPVRAGEGEVIDRLENISSATIVAFFVLIAFFLYLIRSVVLPFVVAGIVAYVATPLVDWMARRTGWRRWPFALLVLFLLLGLTALTVWLAVPPLIAEFQSVTTDFHGTISDFVQRIIGDQGINLGGKQYTPNLIADTIIAAISTALSQTGELLKLASWTVAGIFEFVIGWVVLGYFLIDAHGTGRGLFWLVPPKYREFGRRVWRRVNPVLFRYFFGIFLVVVYSTVGAYLGLGVALQLNHAVPIAIITGFLEVIPIVGPAVGGLIGGLVAVSQAKGSWGIISYIIYIAVMRLSLDQFFAPIVLGTASRMRPTLVMFCFLVGGLLYGALGIILAIPITIFIRTVLAVIYEEQAAGGIVNGKGEPTAL